MTQTRTQKRSLWDRALDAAWPPEEPGDTHVRVAWRFITSWWLRWTVLVACVPLLALYIVGFERDVVYWLFRLVGFVAMFGFAYDWRVRRPRELERRRRAANAAKRRQHKA